jgi:hypothetical protein
MLALSTYGLTTNLAVGVMARAAVGVSVKTTTKTTTKTNTKAVARNKPMRLIGSRLLSQLSVA